MSPTTATITAPASQDVGAAATLFSERPQYAYAGEGRWLPVNDAAHLECERWNVYATMMTARSAAARSAVQ